MLWATLNEILNRSSSKSSIDKISVNGKSIDDAQNMANEFNSFFSEIAENILKDIPELIAKPNDYLNDSGFNFELGKVDPSEIMMHYLFKMNKKSGSTKIISFLLLGFCSLFIQYHRVI